MAFRAPKKREGREHASDEVGIHFTKRRICAREMGGRTGERKESRRAAAPPPTYDFPPGLVTQNLSRKKFRLRRQPSLPKWLPWWGGGGVRLLQPRRARAHPPAWTTHHTIGDCGEGRSARSKSLGPDEGIVRSLQAGVPLTGWAGNRCKLAGTTLWASKPGPCAVAQGTPIGQIRQIR